MQDLRDQGEGRPGGRPHRPALPTLERESDVALSEVITVCNLTILFFLALLGLFAWATEHRWIEASFAGCATIALGVALMRSVR